MAGKDEIRATMRVRRHAVSEEIRARASEEVCAAALARDDVRAAVVARRPFAVYLAARDELDLSPLVEVLEGAGVTVAVPCWDAASRSYVLGDYGGETALVRGAHGIREPAEVRPVAPADIGVWIVPGLAFTADGGRLGYGGGWYDRLLAQAAPDACVLGVAYSFQLVGALPLEPHDRRLTAVLAASVA